jgi:hypothetical protein
MTQKSREVVLMAMRAAKGDDLERARAAFRGKSAADMRKPYGQSGRTCEEILSGYTEAREEWEAAWRELNALLV